MPRYNTSLAPEQGAEPEPALRALSRELAAAQETALDLQMTVAELVAAAGTSGRDALFRLQALDQLAQTLGDLATFAGAVAAATPAGWRLDGRAAVRELRLHDLAARLASGGAAVVAVVRSEGEDDFLL